MRGRGVMRQNLVRWGSSASRRGPAVCGRRFWTRGLVLAVVVSTLGLVQGPAWAADGALDPSFGTGGKVMTAIGASIDYAYSVAVQPDGKIVAAGYTFNGANNDFALVRYNANGSLDSTFGVGGRVTTAIGTSDDYVYAVAVEPDGKIAAAGSSYNGLDFDFALARYNANGSLDGTFGTGGTVTTAIGDAMDVARAVVVQTNGKLVAAGYSYNGSNDDFALIRYNTDGSLDTTFGTGGKVTTSIGTSTDRAYAAAVQSDGKIVAAGMANNGSNDEFALARYTTNGALDPTFDTDGKVSTPVGTSSSRAYAAAIQADGKTVAAGYANNGVNDDFALTRYDVTYPPDVPPETVILSGPWVTSASPDATFTFNGIDPSGPAVASYECKLDVGSWVACLSPKAYTALADGPHTFQVRATDTDGYTDLTPATQSWISDTIAPQTTIDSPPPGTVTNATATFGFSATDSGSGVAFFECSLDSGPWATCNSPRTYAGLGGGTHTFQVRTTDWAGNTDPIPASRTWVVDTTPPDTVIDSGPAGWVSSTTAVFTFSSTEGGSTFACRFDFGAWGPCTSPRTYSGLTEELHTFEVRATDAVGNIDPTPAVRTWTVDATPPETQIDSGPSGTVSATAATFTFSAIDVGSGVDYLECRLDAAPWATCTSPKAYTGLADGPHTFEARATDRVGNTDPTPSSRTWTVDTAPPDTMIFSGPSGTVNSTGATLTFSSTEGGSTFSCRLDLGGWASCTSPKSYTGLADGPHTFEVRATDVAGNTDPTPASRTWTVDATPPETQVDSPRPGTVTSPTATFTFSATDYSGSGVASFECRLDAGSWASCTSPKSYTGLIDGPHTFEVRATDVVGNTDPTPASRTWIVDTGPPDTTILSGPSGAVNATGATFTFSSTEGASTFVCRLDLGVWEPCTSPKSYTGLAEGPHTFRVAATDAVGSTDPTPASRGWTVDTIAPDTSIDSGPSGTATSSSATFTFSGTDSGSGIASFQCQMDTAAWAACTSPKAYSGLADGPHTFSVRAIDQAGNTDPIPASRTWTVQAPPETTIDSGPSGNTADTVAVFTFSANEAATFMCSLDGAPPTLCTSPKLYSGLGLGGHSFSVQATDLAGNPDPTPATRNWTVVSPVRRPDAMIKAFKSINYKGDGIYNSTGAYQTVTVMPMAGLTAAFNLKVANDGNLDDAYTIHGCGTTRGFRVAYAHSGSPITAGVVAGTESTGTLSPGAEWSNATLIVTTAGFLKQGATKTCLIRVTSQADGTTVDAVKAIVKVR